MQAGGRAELLEPPWAQLGSILLCSAGLGDSVGMLGRGWERGFAHQQVSLLLPQELTQPRLMGGIP